MKKICFLFLTAAAIAFVSFVPLPGAAAGAKQPEVSVAQQKPAHKEPKYYMTELSGIIAVYRYGENVPFKLLDTEVERLPSADREMLINKIYIYGDDELQRLIEDYNS